MNRSTLLAALFVGIAGMAVSTEPVAGQPPNKPDAQPYNEADPFARDQSPRRRWYRSEPSPPPPSYYPSPAPYPAYGYYGGTTIAGEATKGLAEMIRARGEAYRSTTEGMINYEDARSRYIDNAAKWQRTYLQMKRTARAYRQEQWEEEMEGVRKYSEHKRETPLPRLGPSQLDPATGHINWPVALKDDEYAEYRSRLEELFVLRAHVSNTGQVAGDIHETARAMQDELKENIRDLPSHQYIAARKFLDAMVHEAVASASG